MGKLEEIIGSTIYDLTHLEINTIIKDEMSASKAPASPRVILHELSEKFHLKLIDLGKKYYPFIGNESDSVELLFRGIQEFTGSSFNSFRELSYRAKDANQYLKENQDLAYKNSQLTDKISEIQDPNNKKPLTMDEIHSDIKMLLRIKTISDDIRAILKIVDKNKTRDNKNLTQNEEDKSQKQKEEEIWKYKFDDPESVKTFRTLSDKVAKEDELVLDLRQLLLFKKANDIGTEKVVLQTIIGIDGDVTTRISQSFADKPIEFINKTHNEAIGISVKFWESLVNVVVKLGGTILSTITNKK